MARGEMHELSLMENVIRIVRQAATDNRLAKVTTINLVVGATSAVNTDALHFAFEILQKEEKFLHGVTLTIEETPARAHCPHCQEDHSLWRMDLLCPSCGHLPLELRSGEEFYVKSIEGEREDG
jgi:hydrogenase nickel incorporation protein HypA/HybF